MNPHRRQHEGFTLIEMMVVVVIMAIAAAGIGFSINALARTSLRSGAVKFAAAVRYAYNRSVSNGTTVRILFDLPGDKFSIQEAHGRITLTRADSFRRIHGVAEEDLDRNGAVDPWALARERLEKPLEPTIGASPFEPITSVGGEPIKRFANVELGRHVQIVRLIVPHEPEPKTERQGAIHFFSTGYTEHAVVELSDGGEGVYSVEVQPLTGRCKIRPEAYQPDQLMDDPEDPGYSEVDD